MRIAALAFIFLLTGCATPVQTGSQCVVPEGALDQETTFTWRSAQATSLDDATGYISPLVVEALEKEVIRELESKGLSFVERRDGDQLTDLELSLTLKTRRELICRTVDEVPCIGDDCKACFELSPNAHIEYRTVGFLAADIYFLDKPTWRGWVERPLYPSERDNPVGVMDAVIPVLFETFPP
jgi:hypothetical protein